MGATDVCPFVPVSGITMEECAELARKLGKRVGEELGIPVYLYEHAASRPEWRNLANIRKGEYEALPEKLKSHLFFQNLLKALGGRPRSCSDLLRSLERVTADLQGADGLVDGQRHR